MRVNRHLNPMPPSCAAQCWMRQVCLFKLGGHLSNNRWYPECPVLLARVLLVVVQTHPLYVILSRVGFLVRVLIHAHHSRTVPLHDFLTLPRSYVHPYWIDVSILASWPPRHCRWSSHSPPRCKAFAGMGKRYATRFYI